MKIVDSFNFYNEYDVLELRFKQHYHHVDRFVICESDYSFTGLYKGYNLEANKDRFAPWWDKVTYIKVTKFPGVDNPWGAEALQRNSWNKGWTDLGANDVILLSDVDEFFRAETFDFIRTTDYDLYELCMPMFFFRFNYMDLKGHYPWRRKAIRGYQDEGEKMFSQLSHLPGGKNISLHHAGWHFSWLGNDDVAHDKLKNFIHTEFNIPSVVDNLSIERSIAQGVDHLNRGGTWGPVIFDDYFPEVIRHEQARFQHLILPTNAGNQRVQDYWPHAILEPRQGFV
jgi:hypothetical protein